MDDDTPGFDEARADRLDGSVLAGRYRVDNVPSWGANTVIVDAVDTVADQPVTVKIVQPDLSRTEDFQRAFRRQVEVAMALTHPNIATVSDWGKTELDGEPTLFWVVEYLGGGSLRDLFDRGRLLEPSQALVVGLEACRALDTAHSRGVVHTEVTPSKLVFGADGRVRIVDFAMAQLLGAQAWAEPATVATHVARYASPEQALGLPVDPKTDVYALSLCLIEAVTGKVPFAGDSTVSTLAARVGKLMPVSADMGSLAAVLERAGRPEAADRTTAAEFGRSLVQAANKLPRPEPIPIMTASLFGAAHSRPAVDESTPEPPTEAAEPDGPGAGPATVAAAAGAGLIAAAGVAAAEVTGTETGIDVAATEPDAVDTGDDLTSDHGTEETGVATTDSGAGTTTTDTTTTDTTTTDTTTTDTTTDGATTTDAATTAGDEPPAPPDDPVVDDPGATTPTGGPEPLLLLTDIADEPPPPEVDDTGAPPADQHGGGVAAPTEEMPAAMAAAAAMATVPPTSELPTTPETTPTTPDPTPSGILYDEERNRRPWGKIVGLTLVALIGLTALGFAAWLLLRTKSYEVPDLVGVDEQVARAAVSGNDWTIVTEHDRSDEVPDIDHVIRTDPVAGEKLDEGQTFVMVLSDGPELRTLPELDGLTLDKARSTLEELRLVAVEAAAQFSETVPEGSIISWQVHDDAALAAGAQVLPDTTIELVVSKGPEPRPAPSLANMTLEQATAVLDDLQLVTARGDDVFSNDVDEGLVVSQSPAPDTPVERGGTVTVQLSKGPDLVPIPDLTDMTYPQAQQALTDAGYTIKSLLGTTEGTFVSISVDGEQVNAGDMFVRGTGVDLVFL